MLQWCRQLIRLRKERVDLRSGDQVLLDVPEGVLAWRRGGETVVATNLSARPVAVTLAGRVLLATDPALEDDAMGTELAPWACVVLASPALR